jgi:hypothetical protein
LAARALTGAADLLRRKGQIKQQNPHRRPKRGAGRDAYATLGSRCLMVLVLLKILAKLREVKLSSTKIIEQPQDRYAQMVREMRT